MRSEDNGLAVERDILAKKLRAQYFRLDPYIRGKGGELAPNRCPQIMAETFVAYHRLGNIVGK
jgi:hypothetical protein